MSVSIFSPAKINLYLAVTGRRVDGYHDLVSVVAPLDFGDELKAEEFRIQNSESSRFTLTCDDPTVPTDSSNLILKAAEAFVAATGGPGLSGVHFRLTKRIPLGAGLGGGSSNAVAALRALNKLSGGLLPEGKLTEIAAALGSDCALFLKNAPVVIRGRGERIEVLPDAAASRLHGRRVLLFKPSFAISTPWAYQRMAARDTDYLPAAKAESQLAVWQRGEAPIEELLFNNMEGVAFEKFIALPVLLEKLRKEFGVAGRMSGSGSACFALLDENFVTASLIGRIRECWGSPAFEQEAKLL